MKGERFFDDTCTEWQFNTIILASYGKSVGVEVVRLDLYDFIEFYCFPINKYSFYDSLGRNRYGWGYAGSCDFPVIKPWE